MPEQVGHDAGPESFSMPPTQNQSPFVPVASRVTYWQDGAKDGVAWYDTLPVLGKEDLREGDLFLKKVYGTKELANDERAIVHGQKFFPGGRGQGSSRSEHAAIVVLKKGKGGQAAEETQLVESTGIGIQQRDPTAEVTYLVFRPKNEMLALWAGEAAKFLVNDDYSPPDQKVNLKTVDPFYTQDRVSGSANPNNPNSRDRRGAVVQKLDGGRPQAPSTFQDRNLLQKMTKKYQSKDITTALVFANRSRELDVKRDVYSYKGALLSEGRRLLGIDGTGVIDKVHRMLHAVDRGEDREVTTFCSALVVLFYEIAAAHLRDCCMQQASAFGSSPVDPTTTHPKMLEAILYKARDKFPLIGKFDTRADTTPRSAKGRRVNI